MDNKFKINQSVGIKGVNNPKDVEEIQLLLQKNGYCNIGIDGKVGNKTIQAIMDFQAKNNINTSGLIVPNQKILNETPPEPRYLPKQYNDSLIPVKSGQFTFDQEGIDRRTSVLFSRVIHQPTIGSGVTIGRGHDMKYRTPCEIRKDLERAGIPSEQAKLISKAALMSGIEAKIFVKNNKHKIGEISNLQQTNLFNLIYPLYVKETKRFFLNKIRNLSLVKATTNNLYNTTSNIHEEIWDLLDENIKIVLIDMKYQGVLYSNFMREFVNSDERKKYLYSYLERLYMESHENRWLNRMKLLK
ncbi:peptidoglycan-binding protein [Taylorella equigenitalis]|uniref:peptidoglycan-binding protein n=1 Tax=Taylorella equigenitalis TaxID=29575 RepID=UPI0023B057DA|nr:peptidoglycan-binding protein [Taylorella equigenitalis]WEE01402.1 peptidoglycan-binding protein [Taylorella equigenitalis]WFD77939.1 peptidoglycan-binding protein [Taylorella equigenitalis]WFD79417.1 peptidoglycan-binding protein [Taylorella equigenitalis]WFD80893.1 peptidoglycan-binding protein [Taylorella equigenitalis]WFD82371.1 peptidoglycan-binding protein [Taylorella equigenitalis]